MSKDTAGSEEEDFEQWLDRQLTGDLATGDLETELRMVVSTIRDMPNIPKDFAVQPLMRFILSHKQQAIKEFGEKLSLDCQNCGRRTPYFEAELRNFNTGMCAACGADALTISFWELDSIITAIQEAMKETN